MANPIFVTGPEARILVKFGQRNRRPDVSEREDKKGMLHNALVITLLFLIVLVLFIAYRAG